MAAVSESIVREFFELHDFLVRQHRKYISPTRNDSEDDIDFFVVNPHPDPASGDLPFILNVQDLPAIQRAVVVVKGWHTEIFSQARLNHAPSILRFVEPKALQQAARAFGGEDTPLKILIVPALPQEAGSREQTIQLLKSKGVDAVIPFRTMLADLIANVAPNRNYQKADLLQMIRIFKVYDFFREPQLELFKAKRRKTGK
jgi:hypothetical protein